MNILKLRESKFRDFSSRFLLLVSLLATDVASAIHTPDTSKKSISKIDKNRDADYTLYSSNPLYTNIAQMANLEAQSSSVESKHSSEIDHLLEDLLVREETQEAELALQASIESGWPTVEKMRDETMIMAYLNTLSSSSDYQLTVIWWTDAPTDKDPWWAGSKYLDGQLQSVSDLTGMQATFLDYHNWNPKKDPRKSIQKKVSDFFKENYGIKIDSIKPTTILWNNGTPTVIKDSYEPSNHPEWFHVYMMKLIRQTDPDFKKVEVKKPDPLTTLTLNSLTDYPALDRQIVWKTILIKNNGEIGTIRLTDEALKNKTLEQFIDLKNPRTGLRERIICTVNIVGTMGIIDFVNTATLADAEQAKRDAEEAKKKAAEDAKKEAEKKKQREQVNKELIASRKLQETLDSIKARNAQLQATNTSIIDLETVLGKTPTIASNGDGLITPLPSISSTDLQDKEPVEIEAMISAIEKQERDLGVIITKREKYRKALNKEKNEGDHGKKMEEEARKQRETTQDIYPKFINLDGTVKVGSQSAKRVNMLVVPFEGMTQEYYVLRANTTTKFKGEAKLSLSSDITLAPLYIKWDNLTDFQASPKAPHASILSVNDLNAGTSKDMGNGMLLKWRIDTVNYPEGNTLEFYREKKK